MALEAKLINIQKARGYHHSDVILQARGRKVLELINQEFDPDRDGTEVLKTNEKFNIDILPPDERENIVDLCRVNEISNLNGFFRAVNSKLKEGGKYIGCVETLEDRKSRLLKKFPTGLNYSYYFLDFIFRRVFPKLPVTNRIHYFITANRNQPISKAETLGRLVFCGFEIERSKTVNGIHYFVAKKVGEPLKKKEPSKGVLMGIPRIGKDKRTVTIYKFRTMHPYAQYLQDYVYRQNNLQDGGKFRNDFRITSWGRFMRKLWIDEIPMFYNLLRGDLKLVGVRPLSEHYFSLYSKELQEKRTQTKPGLIPPFYVDIPRTLDEIMESEMRYLESYLEKPVQTDVKYFFKASGNILFKKARSN